MMKYIIQATVLILATAFVFAISYTPVAGFIPEILIFITLISLIYAFFLRRRRRGQEVFVGNSKEVFVIIAFILLIVFVTGGIRSPIFFLTYFILFGLAFIFEPIMIFFFLLCLAAVFAPQSLQDDLFGNSLKLLSLLFLAPIAFLFGREYKRRENIQKNVENTAESIIQEAERMISTKDKNERLKKAEEIIEDAKKLKKETSQS